MLEIHGALVLIIDGCVQETALLGCTQIRVFREIVFLERIGIQEPEAFQHPKSIGLKFLGA